MAKNGWTTLSITPLTGGLDTRSIPADIPPGWFRWKLNAQVTPEGKLGRRAGFSRAWPEALYDDQGLPLTDPNSGEGIHYHNHDHHHVGDVREPITFMQEITWGDKSRQLFDGTVSRISVLDETAGSWTDIVTGQGDGFGSYWTCAFLQDVVIFTNDVDDVLAYPQGGPAAAITDLRDNCNVTKARIAIEFSGCVLLMNTFEDGKRYASRIRWSDLNDPMRWSLSAGGGDPAISGYQDLDYGDEILAAGFLLGSVYVYTRRKIWRITVSGVADTVFNFQEVYSEPKNQTGCITYPRTLVSTGAAHFYASRDGIYKYSPFVAAPTRDEWLHRASGVMYTKADTRMSGVICNSPVAEYVSEKRELWFSWGTGTNAVNNMTLVAQLDHETADVVDHGFTAFVNFRQEAVSPSICSESQSFLGASGADYTIKEIGNVHYREFVTLRLNGDGDEDPGEDLEELLSEDAFYQVGYFSMIRGMIPTGLFDREKLIRNVLLEDSTLAEVEPCDMRLRIGNSYHLADPNDESIRCSVLWRDVGVQELSCPEEKTIAQMQAQNIRPSTGKEWACHERGRFLWFEFRVQSKEAAVAIGCATFWQRIDFSVMPMLA
jgi:hypothetical protein